MKQVGYPYSDKEKIGQMVFKFYRVALISMAIFLIMIGSLSKVELFMKIIFILNFMFSIMIVALVLVQSCERGILILIVELVPYIFSSSYCILNAQLVQDQQNEGLKNTYHLFLWFSIITLLLAILYRAIKFFDSINQLSIQQYFETNRNQRECNQSNFWLNHQKKQQLFYWIIASILIQILMSLIEIQISWSSSQEILQNTTLSSQSIYLSSGICTLSFFFISWILLEIRVSLNLNSFGFQIFCLFIGSLYIISLTVFLIVFTLIPDHPFYCVLKQIYHSLKLIAFLILVLSPTIKAISSYSKNLLKMLFLLLAWLFIELVLTIPLMSHLEDQFETFTLSWSGCLHFNLYFDIVAFILSIVSIICIKQNMQALFHTKFTLFLMFAMPFKAITENIIIHLIYSNMSELYMSMSGVNWFLVMNYLFFLGMLFGYWFIFNETS